MCDWLNILGLDMTLLNNNGHSAVHKAAVKGQRETCEWLLTAGGLGAEHVRPDYHDGMTPAVMARLEGHDGLAAGVLALTQVPGRRLPSQGVSGSAAAGRCGADRPRG